MKFLVVFALAVACAHADDGSASIVRSEAEVNPDGYNYVYETSNGIYGAARGVVKNLNSENPIQEVTGEFKHTGPDGVSYQVTYVADENGYQPKGDHLPVAPAIPEAIQRALAYIESHPQPQQVGGFAPVAQTAQRFGSPFAKTVASLIGG